MSKWVNLHCHSVHSRLDGAIEIAELVEFCKQNDMPAVAITDHGMLSGLIELYTAATDGGVKPILGTEAYVVYDHTNPKAKRYHEILIAKDYQGYINLCKLASLGYSEGLNAGKYPTIDAAQLASYSDGIICLSGCISSMLARTILAGLDTQELYRERASIARDSFSNPNAVATLRQQWYALKASIAKAKGPRVIALNTQADDLEQFIKELEQSLADDSIGDLVTDLACKSREAWEAAWANACKHVEGRLAIFGDRYYFETQLEHLADQKRYNAYVRMLGKKYNRPVVVTGDSHYLHKEDFHTHKVMLQVRTEKRTEPTVPKGSGLDGHLEAAVTASDGSPDSLATLYDNTVGSSIANKKTKTYLKSRDSFLKKASGFYYASQINTDSTESDSDVGRSFSDWSPIFYVHTYDEMIAEGAIPQELANTLLIADTIDVTIPLHSSTNRIVHMPEFPIPTQFDSADDYLTDLVKDYLNDYVANTGKDVTPYYSRLNYELTTIKAAGFSNYFLIVWDYVLYGRSSGALVGPGRGSAAASLVTFLLGITKLDPLDFPELMFERFLTPGRLDMPDIDVDFDAISAERIYQYCKDKYGDNNVTKIGTISVIGVRQALQDVGRVLNVPYLDVELASRILREYHPDEDDDVEDNKAQFSIAAVCSHSNDLLELRNKSPLHQQWFTYADSLQGKKRNASVHASGVAIASQDLKELGVPMMISNGTIITQYGMDDLAKLGIPKFDQLKLSNLNIIADTERLIGEEFSIDEIPLDDPDTYAALSRGDNLGIFQMAQPKTRAALKAIKPANLSDLAAVITIIRPGLLARDPATSMSMDELFKARRSGQMPVQYMFEFLAEYTESTYGIIVYQEQILKILWAAGLSMLDADALRKVLGKKLMSKAKAFEDRFVEGCMANLGLNRDDADTLWSLVVEFASYSFNYAHALSYALIGYWTSYLKTHYPAQFLAATLTAQSNKNSPNSKVQMGKLLDDAKAFNRDIPILPPSVNKSEEGFSIEPVLKDGDSYREAIRFGLSGLKFVAGVCGPVLQARLVSGIYSSIEDFDQRVSKEYGKKVNKQALASLNVAGAFDDMTANRSEGAHVIEILRAPTKTKAAALKEEGYVEESIPSQSKAQADLCFGYMFNKNSKDLLGIEVDNFFCAAHGDYVTLGGQVEDLKLFRSSRRGSVYHGLTLRTPHGDVKVMAFPKRNGNNKEYLDTLASILQTNLTVIVQGNVKGDDLFFADKITPPRKSYRLKVDIPDQN